MKAFILKPLSVILLLVIASSFSSCHTDADDEPSLLGNWVEEAPVAERTWLYFHTGNRVSKLEGDGDVQMFSYRMQGDQIVLWPEGQSETAGSFSLFFRQIDPDSFQIENLYETFPEMETTYMIFRRD